MNRLVRLAVISALAVALGGLSACPSEPTPPPPKRLPVPQALFGTWVHGKRSITFRPNNTFRWHQMRPCGAPPCPMVQRAGTWRLDRGRILLMTNKNQAYTVRFKLLWGPRRARFHFLEWNVAAEFRYSG